MTVTPFCLSAALGGTKYRTVLIALRAKRLMPYLAVLRYFYFHGTKTVEVTIRYGTAILQLPRYYRAIPSDQSTAELQLQHCVG